METPRASFRKRPKWLAKRVALDRVSGHVRTLVGELGLSTVCRSARCPNASECFAQGTATFMILGEVCTRNCRFCAIKGGVPEAPDDSEPARVGEAVSRLGLEHAVVTSVTRDDLEDEGARQFTRTIRAIRDRSSATIEVLTPDFRGDREALREVIEAGPDIFNHNLETVRRLYGSVRPQADYERSLAVLRAAKEMNEAVVFAKSSPFPEEELLLEHIYAA